MQPLTGSQKKYLRGLAHGQKPVVFIGQNGLTKNVVKTAKESLDHHELIKVKCIDFKEKELKKELAGKLETRTGAALVGIIGHMIILYRRQPDPDKRRITLPKATATRPSAPDGP